MNALASYLMQVLPGGMAYPDAAQLCLRLYSTVDGVPDRLLPLGKNELGDAFAELSSAGQGLKLACNALWSLSA